MADLPPIDITTDETTGDRFLVYGTDKGLRIDIRYDGETLWMTQAQIAALFGRDVSVISRHLGKIFETNELDEMTSLQKMQATLGRPSIIYNLDVVIALGFRVESPQATVFRKWANHVLGTFARKGFVVDKERLKAPENADRIAELRDIIRDIRSDEANLYRELRNICALCQDYDSKSDSWRTFFQETQAKLVHAVTSMTPSEIIRSRADADASHMGLTNWPGDRIRKSDVTVSKSFLAEGEIKELNRLTSILLDIFEDQLDMGRIAVMPDLISLLDPPQDPPQKAIGRTPLSRPAPSPSTAHQSIYPSVGRPNCSRTASSREGFRPTVRPSWMAISAGTPVDAR
ncbi:RhuM family protein [Rhodospirillum sp. A1_3_36]|uniref:RhuM family protein n=1 Tax=Rhodospirillum sp. A1_3_36 TaxID=3391666 RepID=UPI0039A6A31F